MVQVSSRSSLGMESSYNHQVPLQWSTGPMPTRSLIGYKHIVTIIDEHSRKSWICFLKTKDEAFSCFKEFKALVENATRKNIKVLHSDNRGEYTDSDFTGFCLNESIRRE